MPVKLGVNSVSLTHHNGALCLARETANFFGLLALITKFKCIIRVNNKVEESHNLEYKSADALLQIGNKGGSKDGAVELIKDVSAMANSAGGVIIYGIKEFDDIECKHPPEKVTPIKRQDFSKERIEQLLNGNIMPKIEGLLIHPIELENVNEVAFAIEVPQSHTAHQNTKDKRYYKRQNFEAVAMLDYEVRDVMNRATYPQLTLDIEIVTEVNEPRYWQKDLEYITEYTLIRTFSKNI